MTVFARITRVTRLAWLTAPLLAVAACGGAEPSFHVRDPSVVVRSDAAFTRSVDFPARVESTVDAGTHGTASSLSLALDQASDILAGKQRH